MKHSLNVVRLTLALPLVLAFPGCRCSGSAKTRGRASARVAPRPTETWRTIAAREDERRIDAVLLGATRDADASVRARAAWALGRIGSARAEEPLRRLLGDPSAEVRRAAAYATGFLADGASAQAQVVLVGRFVAETDEQTRANLAYALGRLGGSEAEPLLIEALLSGSSALQAAAAQALGAHGWRSRAVGAEVYRALALALFRFGRFADRPSVAPAAAFALARLRLAPPGLAPAVVEALVLGARSADPDVRVFALRALGAQPGEAGLSAIDQAVRDPDWRVRVNAVRALGERGTQGARRLAAAMERSWSELRASEQRLAGPEPHVLLQALSSAADLGPDPNLARVAESIFDQAEADLRAGSAVDAPLRRSLGRIHCAAAVAMDRAKNWPGRVLRCGAETVGSVERQLLAVDVLEKARGGEAARVREFVRYSASPERSVRAAALRALGGLAGTNPAASAAIVRGLAATDTSELQAACEALIAWRARPARERAPLVDAPVIAERLASAVARAASPEEVETILSVLGAVRAVAREIPVSDTIRRTLEAQARAGNATVRRAAAEAIEALDLEARPPDEADAQARGPANPLDVDALERLLRPTESPSARIVTSRGEITVALLPREAPATVLNFIRLARRGFYQGLAFHRVVPNFVIQGGDPRGDGGGGPGYTIRCEYTDRPYRTGTVGMALAGRDTGGSQFFITHSPQPSLDGRYTVFGQVTGGQSVVDSIQVGDRIERIEIRGAD